MSFRIRHSPRFQREDPIDQLLVPSIYDDEFDNSVLSPNWTRVNLFDDVNPIAPFTGFSGTGSRWSLDGVPGGVGRRSWYMIQPDPASVSAQLNTAVVKPIPLPTEYFIWTRASFNYLNAGQTNNDATTYFGVIDLVSGDRTYLTLNESDANTIQVEFARSIGGAGTSTALTNNVGGAGLTKGQVAHTIGIQNLSGTYHAWMLSAAGNWQWIASNVPGGNILTHAFLSVGTVSTAPGNVVCGFDFFRFKVGRYLP